MALSIAGSLFIFLMAAITVYGYFHFARPGRVYTHLGSRAEPVLEDGRPARFYAVVQALQWLGERVPVSAEDASAERRRLMAAGFRQDSALYVEYGIRLALAALLLLLAVAARTFWVPPGLLAIVVPLTAALVGFFVPGLVLDTLIDRRQTVLRLSLPDALDLMVVCVEAGLGLDQALRSVSGELRITHPELSSELALVSLEMRAGVNRATALANLAARTGETELRKLVAVLIQTDRFGTSMADALRTHSEFMRIRRRQDAEERANKIGVKLIFPVFIFVLPAMIIVAAGPGLLQLFKNLFPLMRNSQL